jgi:O-methyltransferase
MKSGAEVLMPGLAAVYRRQQSRAPDWLLTSLQIANPSHRDDFYTLARVVDSIERFEGDVAECGVYKGSTLLGVTHRLRARGLRNVRVLGFDSFAGLPEPVTQDALGDGEYHPRALRGVFNDARFDRLQAKIRALGFDDQVTLIKGFFEDTLPTLEEGKFSVVHIDVDLYQSYATCLNHFYPRVVPGGYLVFDEYDFSSDVYPGAQRAIDEFLADKPEKVERFSEARDPRFFIRKR